MISLSLGLLQKQGDGGLDDLYQNVLLKIIIKERFSLKNLVLKTEPALQLLFLKNHKLHRPKFFLLR